MSTGTKLKHAPATHPFLHGTEVTVLRLGMISTPYVEGRAVIRAAGAEANQYWVTFLGDPVHRLRFVYAVCQSPHLLDALLMLWRAEPGISFDDGFANDNASLGRTK